MIAAAFALALVTVHVAAEIPSYIHVCGRQDPHLDQCILNSIENLKDKICEGMPELNIQSNNPLLLDELVIFNTPNSKLFFKDANVMGLCDFMINSFRIDLDKGHFDVDLLFKQIRINGTYDLNARLVMPIVNKGPVYIVTDNVGATVSADMKLVTKNDQNKAYISKMTINLDLKGYDIQFSNETQLSQLRNLVRNFLGDNQQQIIESFKPTLEEAITKLVISVANNIFKNFTYDELFPDHA